MSKAAAGVLSEEIIRKERLEAKNAMWGGRPYCDHISFFFEPIPAALLPNIFPKDHHAWSKGKKLYEHIIDTRALPQKIDYDIVESTKFIAAYDDFATKNNWVDENPRLFKEWSQLEDRLMRQWGERGNDRSMLESKIQENQGIIADKYRDFAKRIDYEDNKYKYASAVPHLMLWIPGGKILVNSINYLVMGSDKRYPVRVPNIRPSWLR